MDADVSSVMPEDRASPADPLSIEFANTRYAVRGQLRDGIDTPERLLAWLGDHAEELGVPDADAELAEEIRGTGVAPFLALRETIRSLFRSASAHRVGTQAELDVLNRAALASPSAPALAVRDSGYAIVQRNCSTGVPVTLSAIARDAIYLLGRASAGPVRSCHGPGCVLFFVSGDPRRKWCCAACGNRARAARHYLRHRDG
jgi:predicted RNA-binding Zn ribbon-like protein